MTRRERARRLLNAVWPSMIVLAVLVGTAGVIAGKQRSPILAGIVLIMAGIAASAYACQQAVELAAETPRIKSKTSAPGTRLGRGMRVLGSMLGRLDAVLFIVGPLIIAVVAFWHAIRALRQ